jgi:hypothetical protein
MSGTIKNFDVFAAFNRASCRDSPNKADLRILLSVLALSLCGCSGKFDPQIYAETTAKYILKPPHKALYINTTDFAMYPRWDRPDAQEALAQAENDCIEGSRKRRSDPGRCAPFYFEERRLIDPTIYE